MRLRRREFLQVTAASMQCAIPVRAVQAAAAANAPGWWMTEPIRWVQTNLRETDTALDPGRLVNQLIDFRANCLLIGMGGIVAHYPTKVEHHVVSPYLPPGRDMFGEVLELAHKNRIRVIGRFDFSKASRPVFDAHPEWFFRTGAGEPVVYNGLYSTCIAGGYYAEKAMEILAEALTNYDVDGLFFNMFSNPTTDYSGADVGSCHCDACGRMYREQTGRELPARADAEYRRLLDGARSRAGRRTAEIIHRLRPGAGVFHYSQEFSDGIMSESNTGVDRPLPLWLYASSDNVNRARNSRPERMAVNLCIPFVDFPWRFTTVAPAEIRLRLWQNVAHGGAAALVLPGTMDQQDRTAIDAARPVFRWLGDHEAYFVGQESAARVLLLGRPAGVQDYRGLFRLLSEDHIPFAVCDNLDWLGRREADLIVLAGPAPPELEPWVRRGGRMLVASSGAAPFGIAQTGRRWERARGYLRVRDHGIFPSLRNTQLVMLDGALTESEGASPLTFVPPSMIGPPEKVHVDMKDTAIPGLVLKDHGRGKVAWLPWDLGRLYYRHSQTSHAGLMHDLIDLLLPAGRQLRTDAHPLVEVALMRRRDRHLVHFINLTGHSQTGYFDPVPMSGIRVAVAGDFRSARAVRAGEVLPVTHRDGTSEFTLPALAMYELVELGAS
jgi:Hypothetical glycosyl hydrolase 6